MAKIYFPNLNALRFFAAFAVFVHHIEQFKNILGFSNFWHLKAIQQLGKLGVVLFFVLSGFLITYLLLSEKKSDKSINIKAFYIRRILRIWPLYFLIFLISFFIIPNIGLFDIGAWSDKLSNNFSIKFLLYLIFLPNVALAIFPPIPYASQLWSIGVEEYFYLIWAPLIKVSKDVLRHLYLVIILYLGLKFGLKIVDFIFPNFPYLLQIRNVVSLFSIDCMAIGGIFAYAYFKKNSLFELCSSKKLLFSVYTILFVCLILGFKIPYFNFEFYSILFGIIILNLATNKLFEKSLENRTLNYFGKISYGIYMFHPLCIVFVLKILNLYQVNNFYTQFGLSLLLTILVSSCSYHLIEKWFLNKKNNFKTVESY